MGKIYLDYDQAALDAQYDQATLVPDLSDYHARSTARTNAAKTAYRCFERVAYGRHPDEWYDVYAPKELQARDLGKGAPVIVFFHGGAWRVKQAATMGTAAPAYVEAGAIFVAVNFSVAPEANLDTMVRQSRDATARAAKHAAEWGGDAQRLFVLGHSSGAHQAANVAVTDWRTYGLAKDLVKGLAVTSGPYDLEPVILSKRNEYLHLDPAMAERNSAAKHLRADLPPAIVAWGGNELDEFKRQGAAFAEAWEGATGSVTRLVFPENNHFDQYDEIGKEDSHFTLSFLSMMGLR
jgi:arylformamidase